MNKVILTGRVSQTPKIKQTGTVKVAEYGLAVDRPYKREGQPTVDFFNCTAFSHNADFAEKYFQKGMKIGVSGRLQTSSWNAQDGSKRYKTEVIVDEQEFLQKKSENATENVSQRQEWNDATQEELPFV